MGEFSGQRVKHSLDTPRKGFAAAVVKMLVTSTARRKRTRISHGHEPGSY